MEPTCCRCSSANHACFTTRALSAIDQFLYQSPRYSQWNDPLRFAARVDRFVDQHSTPL
jgi:hypothetical protein